MHGATSVDSGVGTHVLGVEGISRKVVNPITEIVVTGHAKASILAADGVADVKCHYISIAMFR